MWCLFSFLNLHYLTLFDPISARLAQYLPNLNSTKCRNCDLCDALCGALYVKFRLPLLLHFILLFRPRCICTVVFLCHFQKSLDFLRSKYIINLSELKKSEVKRCLREPGGLKLTILCALISKYALTKKPMRNYLPTVQVITSLVLKQSEKEFICFYRPIQKKNNALPGDWKSRAKRYKSTRGFPLVNLIIPKRRTSYKEKRGFYHDKSRIRTPHD